MYEKIVTLPASTGRISNLFRLLQDLSGEAAALWHSSAEELKERGLMWVVIRYEFELQRQPRANESLRLQTWASPVRHRMSQRNYLGFDEKGDCVLRGAGTWAIADFASRSMVDPAENGVTLIPEVLGTEPPRPAVPARIPLEYSFPYHVTEQDLDINRHMNNARYFDAVQDCVKEKAGDRLPARIRVMYEAESRLGDELTVRWGQQGAYFYFTGERGDTGCFRLGLEYRPEDLSENN